MAIRQASHSLACNVSQCRNGAFESHIKNGSVEHRPPRSATRFQSVEGSHNFYHRSLSRSEFWASDKPYLFSTRGIEVRVPDVTRDDLQIIQSCDQEFQSHPFSANNAGIRDARRCFSQVTPATKRAFRVRSIFTSKMM